MGRSQGTAFRWLVQGVGEVETHLPGLVARLLILFLLATAPATVLAQPEINLTLTDGAASEAGPDIGSFTVTRNTNPASFFDVFVRLEPASTASMPADFTVSGWSGFVGDVGFVRIQGGQFSRTVTITPQRDNLVEGTENVQVTLQPDASYTVGADTQAQIDITDDPVEVTLSLVDGDASEDGPDPGSFTVARSNNGNTLVFLDVLVRLEPSSTATVNADFTVAGWSPHQPPNIFFVRIQGSQFSRTVTINPIADANETEGDETVEVAIHNNASVYLVGNPNQAVITIADLVSALFEDGFENLPP